MRSICVIGAGPAGLIAAIEAQQNASVTILERGSSAGNKLLLTGGGRCNLTHMGAIEDFIKACRPYGNSLKPAFFAFSPQELSNFFQERHLETITEPNGCIFPRFGRASDVLRILLQEAGGKGVRLVTGDRVRRIEKREDRFVVQTESRSESYGSVIVATGGVSWPQTGSSGDGYLFAQQFGHTVTSPIGILCPIVCKEDWPGALQGTSLEQAAITVKSGGKPVVCKGAAVFTEDGIGGPAAFDVTRVSAPLVRQQLPVGAHLDFCPQVSASQLETELIKACAEHPKKETSSIMNAYLPRRVCELLLKMANVKPGACGGQLRREERRHLLEFVKQMPLTIVGHAPIEKATVTGGGISVKEIDSRTMQSRLCEGLFFAGEIIDADGPCGGYNLQIAFSTGALAGRSAARYVNAGSI